jgi:toxin secretion/phage lysis holin
MIIKEGATKGIIGAVSGVLLYLYNCFDGLMFVLFILSIMDYITGIIKTIVNPKLKFNWNKGLYGASKKMLYIFVVTSAFLADYTITSISQNINLSFDTNGKIGVIAILYLIGNEGFSLLQNLHKIGLPVPPVLLRFYGEVKKAKTK